MSEIVHGIRRWVSWGAASPVETFLNQVQCLSGLAVSFFLLWAGSEYEGRSCEYPLQTWLKVAGGSIMVIIMSMFAIIPFCQKRDFVYISDGVVILLALFGGLFALFELVWMLLGSYWVFTIDSDECDTRTWEISFWSLIAFHSYMGVFLLKGCLNCAHHYNDTYAL